MAVLLCGAVCLLSGSEALKADVGVKAVRLRYQFPHNFAAKQAVLVP